MIPDFGQLSLPLNLAIFAIAAVAVWVGGTRVADFADELARRFNLSHAVLGLFLLAGVTSLPEVATSFTAASAGNADLAVNNLLGSVVMQVVWLALADLAFGKRALTSLVPDSLVMLQGALVIILLSLVSIAVTVGDIMLFSAGAWSWGLLGAAIYCLVKLAGTDRQRKPWVVNPDDPVVAEEAAAHDDMPRTHRDKGSFLLLTQLALFAALILVAGYTVASVGAAIAGQSGLGQSFVGFALLAIATSLPEASTVFATVRRGFYTMAISDILGTNILNVALIAGVDLIDAADPVLNRVGMFSALAAGLGITVTALLLMGLAERADRTVWRMGIDSLLILVVYAGGLVLLFQLRGGA